MSFRKRLFCTLFSAFAISTQSAWAEPPGEHPGGEEESSAHRACLQKQADAMQGVVGFSSSACFAAQILRMELAQLKFALMTPEMMSCHLNAELSDAIAAGTWDGTTLPATITKSFGPAGSSEVGFKMVFDTSTDTSYEKMATISAKGPNDTDFTDIAKLFFTGSGTSAKGSLTLHNVSKMMMSGGGEGSGGFSANETQYSVWDNTGTTAISDMGETACNYVETMHSVSHGGTFLGTTTAGSDGLPDFTMTTQYWKCPDGKFRLKSVRVGGFGGSVGTHSIVAEDTIGDGVAVTVIVDDPATNSGVGDPNASSKDPNTLGMKSFTVNTNAGTCSSVPIASFTGTRYELPLPPQDLKNAGSGGGAFSGGSGEGSGVHWDHPPSDFLPPAD